MLLLVGIVAFITLSLSLQTLSGIPVFKVLFSPGSLSPAEKKKRTIAIIVLLSSIGILVLTIVWYVLRQGGLMGVGADSVQTGNRERIPFSLKTFDAQRRYMQRTGSRAARESQKVEDSRRQVRNHDTPLRLDDDDAEEQDLQRQLEELARERAEKPQRRGQVIFGGA